MQSRAQGCRQWCTNPIEHMHNCPRAPTSTPTELSHIWKIEVPDDIVGHLIGRNRQFFHRIEENTRCTITCMNTGTYTHDQWWRTIEITATTKNDLTEAQKQFLFRYNNALWYMWNK